MDELPKTIGGKIKRKLIRTRDGVTDDKVHSPASDTSHADESWHKSRAGKGINLNARGWLASPSFFAHRAVELPT